MKRAALLLLAAAVAACDDTVAPIPNPTPIAAVARRAAVTTPSGVSYTATDLGNLGSIYGGYAQYINENSQVAGFAYPPNGTYHAFQWQNGVMTDLGTLGGSYSQPSGENQSGAVVGYSYLAGDNYYHAVLWSGGSTTDLGTLPGDDYSYPYAMNDHNQVVMASWGNTGQRLVLSDGGTLTQITGLIPGYSCQYSQAINNSGEVAVSGCAPDGQHAFKWLNGVITDLGNLGSYYGSVYSYPTDINDAGDVVGYSQTSTGEIHPFKWHNGAMIDLGVPSGSLYAFANVVNQAGNAAGYAYDVNGQYHPVAWVGGAVIDIGTPSSWGQYAFAATINDNNQVNGYTYDWSTNVYRAWLWESGGVTDLGTLPGGTSAFTYTPGSLNNKGQVVGASTRDGVAYYFEPTLWDPEETTIMVTVDIKPGSTPNSVNPRAKGVIPVAVLSSATFDATTIDVATVRFGPGKASEAHGTGHPEDINGDGRVDLVLHFDTQTSGITCGMASADLTGKTTANTTIKGSDAVVTVGCK